MSRTYKDAPYWVKRKRSAYSKDIKNEIQPNFIEKKEVEILPETVYFHSLFNSDMSNVLRKKTVQTIHYEEISYPDTFQTGFMFDFPVKNETVESPLVRELAANIYNKVTGAKKTQHDLSYIPQRIHKYDRVSFLVEDNLLMTLSYNRHYNTKNPNTNKDDYGSMLKLGVSINIINDLQEDNKVIIHSYQKFTNDDKHFRFTPSAEFCSCFTCNPDKAHIDPKKNKVPTRGGKSELRKRINDYKEVYNAYKRKEYEKNTTGTNNDFDTPAEIEDYFNQKEDKIL